MKLKKLIAPLCVVAILTVGILNSNLNNKPPHFSEMTLSNTEAMASGETNNGKGSVEVGECDLPFFWLGIIIRKCGTTVVTCVGDSKDDCTGRQCTESHFSWM